MNQEVAVYNDGNGNWRNCSDGEVFGLGPGKAGELRIIVNGTDIEKLKTKLDKAYAQVERQKYIIQRMERTHELEMDWRDKVLKANLWARLTWVFKGVKIKIKTID